jgi:HK97 family phage major capsid protein
MTRDELKALIKDVAGAVYAEAFAANDAEMKKQEATKTGWFAEMAKNIQQPGKDVESVRTLEQKGLLTARVIRALAAGRGDQEKALKHNANTWKDESVQKALEASTASAGGVLLPEQLSQDIVELLRPMAVVRRMGPTVLQMPVGTIRIPKLVAGSAAAYIGENTNAGVTQPQFGQVVLSLKKLAALVPISNDLLRYSNPGADSIVRSDLVRAMAQREDGAFIRDNGTQYTPKGLRYWALAGNLLAQTGTDILADITTNLGRPILALKNANVPMTRPGWLFSPRTEHRLMTIQNGVGQFVYRPEMMDGRLWRYPYATTTQIPDNLGGGTESEIYLVDFDDVAIGEAMSLSVDASAEASYTSGSSTVSAFQQDQTVVRAIAEHDFVARREQAIAILTGITWGA